MKYVASSSSAAAISASITASALLTVFAAFGLAQRGGGRNTITASALLTVFAVFLGISLALGMAETNPVAFAQTLSDNYDLGPSNTDATGITELNGKIYVVDSGETKIFAYNADGTRVSASDVNLGLNNGNPAGITALHGKLLVVDNNDGKVYAYNPNDSRASSSDFNLDAANGNPNGITALNGNLWIVDNTANKVFVYNPDGTLVSSSEIGLSSDNGDSKGITALHGKLWVVDRTDNIVYVYNPDGTQDSSFEFALDAANASATGITTLHGKIWVVDNGGEKLYVYDDVPAPSAFSFRTDEDNSITSGITSLNGKFWVLDSGDDKVFAYNADGTRAATSFDFDLHSTNDSPFGITALNGKLWVADNAGEKVYAYNADGTRVSGSDFNLVSANDSPAGITSFNGKFYVLDRTNSADKVYAYNADGTRAATSLDFSLPSANTSSFGITALYDKFYVVDLDGTVYAYNTVDGSRAASSDFSLKKDSSSDGITALHGKLWVVDGSTPATVYPYNPDGTRDLLLNINLDTDNGNPSGIASASTNGTLWVVDAVNTKVYAYNRTDGIVGSDFNFELDSNNGSPTGITAFDDKLYVLDETDTKVYAYYANSLDDNDGTRASGSDFNLDTDNTAPTGITSSDNKFWIVDSTTGDYKVYAYNTADGSRAASSDFDLSVHTSSPQSITAHEGKLWIGDSNNIRVYNADGTRDAASEFDLNSENHSIDGITVSDGRFWVVDASDDKIYSYDVPTPDIIVPTLSLVSIVSDNVDTSRATTDDTVTLSFTASENIETPTVTINGVAADTVTGSGDTWSATKIITASDVDGSTVTFTIDFTDFATNAGAQVTATDDSSAVTVYQTAPDTTPPILTVVSIESNNSNDTTMATLGDTITLSFTSDEPIETPTVTINGVTVSAVIESGNTWSATKTTTPADADGPVTFRITFTDLAANDGIAVTSPTAGNSGVTVNKTAPTLIAVSIESNNSDTSRATLDDIITLSFTSSEPIGTPDVTINGITATVAPAVAGSTTSWSATKAITAADNDGAVEFTIDFTDLATNDGIQITSTMDGSSVTVDQTAPTLIDVSIESNSLDTTLATAGNTVTLSFTSDEPILPPTVTISGDGASAIVTGSGVSWSATKTVASTDDDGVVTFSITYSDLATNDGSIITSPTADNPDVTVDNTAPELDTVSIASDNTDPSRATTGDTVTLTFTSLEPIQTPTVTFGGISADTVTGSGNTWSATKIIIAADVDGSAVTFTIDFTDWATNDGTPVTSTTDSSVVTVYQPTLDTTAPELIAVSIESNNSDTSRATLDDIITLSFTSDESIGTPDVTINTVTATVAPAVAGSTTSWSATKTITAADNDGAVEFTIDFTDLATNDGIQITSITTGSSVTVDQTAPTLTAVSIESNNSNDTTLATAGNTITLSFTSSEPILPPTVTISGDGASAIVTGSNTSWSATKTVASTDDDGVVTFSITYSDLASNDGGISTSPTVDNPDVTVDNTDPELPQVSIESNNSNDTTLATAGDTVTLSFIFSEPILPPTVTISGDGASAIVTGSGDTWSATKTVVSTDSDGDVTFTIDFTDLATNDGVPVTSTGNPLYVTVDNTAPTLTTVSIESDNTDTNLATTDDTVTLEFTSLEPIQTPAVTFGGISADTVTESGNTWSATKIITAADADGSAVTFAISFSDLATNDGTLVTSTTDSSVVTVYQTAPDTTDPELNIVSIESNNSDTSRATLGDIITLSFTSSEPIETPDVTINGDIAAAASGSDNTWSATKTITSGDADGPVTFTIDFTDLAANDGTQVTSITTGSGVTVDQTAPELTAVTITSNNSNPSRATTDDIVTLSFTSSENIGTPIVTFGGVTATVTGSTTSWSATKTITAADADDSIVTFAINYSDLATNAGTQVTSITTGSSVTVYQTAPDTTAPTLTVVSIESNNSNDPSLATTDDTITLSFTSSEPIGTPTVTINTATATVTPAVAGSTTSWSATKTITAADNDGAVAFTIDFSDLADTPNVGTQVIATKDGTGVTVDKTVPTLSPVTLESSNADQFLATKDDTITLRFTASEDIVTPVVTINGVDASATVTGSGDTWSATKIITAADVDGSTVTFTIDFTDLATNVGTTVIDVTADVATITVDQTVPTLHTISITSDNSDDNTLATAGNTVTLSFESSEDIKTPVVTINQVPVTPVAVGDSTAWSATRIITSSDADGIVDFTINYSDLASNTGVEVTGITVGSDVTVDNTAPTLTAVSITSDNLNDTTRATDGNTVTLSFTSSEPIETPTVTFGGVAASVTVTGSNTSWNAETTIASTDVEGAVAFSISYSDLVANDGSIVTRPTAGNPDVTVDNTAPELTVVSIESNNSNDSSLATDGNTITLSFTSSEPILQPIVTISGDGASAIVTGSGISWSATKTVASTDDDGAVAFSITYSDLATNDGTTVTSVNDGTSVTVDQTAPTLSLVSIVSNNADPSRATTDDTITLSFTSSEPILEPTVTFSGVAASAVTGSNTSWSATKTITSADADGSTVTFAIDFTDLATNGGISITGPTDSTSVTVYQTAPDTTAPTLTVVSIVSNNSNDSSLATTDNTITLSFTSSEPIETPDVTINGDIAAAASGSGNTWSATKTITSGDADGPVTFTIDFTDLAANDGTQVTSITTGSGVTVDQTAPELTAVSIVSNNSNDTTRATAGNTVTLSFTSSEPILPPTVTISGDGASAVVTGSNTSWSATKTVASTDADGAVAFSITYSDLATNDGTQVTSVNDGTSVTVDQTAPTLSLVSIVSDNTDTSRATTGNTVTLSFTSSEPILEPTVTFGGVAASAVIGGDNTSWSATKTITSADADGSTVTFAIDFTDLATNDGILITGPTDSTSVTVYQTAPDTTAPTLTVVSIRSDNSNDSSLATTDDTITLSFTSSENIGTPTVTFDGVAASVTVTGSNTSWSAETTITDADSDGAVEFTIDFSDLAATPNAGTQVIATKDGTSVTVDTTAPTLSLVSIVSDNTDPSRATTDNTITLSFTSSEPILEPTVTFGGVDASAVIGGDNTSWSATKTITSADADGSTVTFAIDFTDLAANGGISIIGPTDSTSVTVYQTAPDTTAPTLTVVSIESNNSNDSSLATTDDTITLSFTSSEPIGTPTVTINTATATVTPAAPGSTTSWSAETTITSTDADGVVTFTIAFSDLAATPNDGTPVTDTTDNTGVTVDNTAPTRNSRGSDDDSKTRPTFGISGQTFAQIVNCGYSMDGVCTNVTEYHVDYNRQIIQTGTTHDFALKAYAQNGMKSFVIGFGVNEVGAPASESEASITVNLGRDYTLDSTYTIDSVEYDNDENVIGENATFAVSGVSCNGGSDDDNDDDSSIIQKDQTQCTQLLIDGVLFREAMYDEPFMIEAVDAKRKVITHYMNEGLQIIGESINEPPTHKFSSKKTSQSDAVILELTRTDKLKNIWTDQFGYTWSADTPDEWYYVDGPVPDNSSACDSMDHRVCDAFAEKLKYHTSKMESLRDSMYGDIYVAEPFDDLDEVVTFLMTPGESRTQFLDDNAMMWIRN